MKKFENAFARYIGRKHAICVPSGRMALYLSLCALGLQERDVVILPAYTVPEVVTMLRCAGVAGKFADIDPVTYNIDPYFVRKNMGENVRAILMTHLYGKPCNVDALTEMARKNELFIIEDSAQACGAEFKSKKCGTFGKVSYFSFGLVKNLNTVGGGMLTTDDDELASKFRDVIKDYSYPSRLEILKKVVFCTILWIATHPPIFTLFIYPVLRLLDLVGKTAIVDQAFDEKDVGMKTLPASYRKKFTNLQACMGLEQLKRIDEFNKRRIKCGHSLRKRISDIAGLKMSSSPGHVKDICLNFMVQVENRDHVIRGLLRRGVDTSRGYLHDCSCLPVFQEFAQDCPAAKSLSKNGFYIPINPFQADREIARVADALREALQDEEK